MIYIYIAVSYTAWAISNYQVSQKCPHDEEVYANECVSHIYRAKTIKYDSDDSAGDDDDDDDDDDGDDNSDSDDDANYNVPLRIYAFSHLSEFAQLLINVSVISRDVALLYTRIGPMQGTLNAVGIANCIDHHHKHHHHHHTHHTHRHHHHTHHHHHHLS